jgi:transposase
VVVGVVMVAGWPIAHHVWAGNTRDSKTVAEVVQDLRKRFQFRQAVFVGDRGMVTEKNLDVLQKTDPAADDAWGFLLGMTRRRNPEAEALIDRLDESRWQECPGGINVQEATVKQRTRVQEVVSDRGGVRVFVVDSDERRDYEKRQREKAMERVRVSLEKLRTRVANGKLKDPAKIGAAAQRVLTRNHGHRYYAWELCDGGFQFQEHPVNLPREKKYEGKYLIQTDQTDMTPQDGVAHYKELNEVERGFRSLKDPIGMRPIWHTNERRVRGHIFVAALAFLIERMLERALKDAKVPLSAQDALTALQTIRHVRFQVDAEERTGVTPGSARARQVLKALKITELRPPTPAEGPQTTM